MLTEWSPDFYFPLAYLQQKQWVRDFTSVASPNSAVKTENNCLRSALELVWKSEQSKWSFDKTFNGSLYFSSALIRLDLLSPWGQTLAVLISDPQKTILYHLNRKRSWQIFPTPTKNAPIHIWEYLSHAYLSQTLWPNRYEKSFTQQGTWFQLIGADNLFLWNHKNGQQFYWSSQKEEQIKWVWLGPQLRISYQNPQYEVPGVAQKSALKTQFRPIMAHQEWSLYQDAQPNFDSVLLEKITWNWKETKSGCADSKQISKPESFNPQQYPAVSSWDDLMAE